MECLSGNAKKKRTLSVHWGKDDQFATSAKLLDTTCEFYGFNDYLIEIIN